MSFAVHCCLVWCVGVPQSFFTVHIVSCGSDSRYLNHSKSKKKIETSSEILFEFHTCTNILCTTLQYIYK